MTYLELYEKASWDLAHNNITVGEYDERVKPLHQEITSAIVELEKIKTEIDDLDRHFDNDYFSGNKEPMFKCNEVFEILDKRISEMKGEEK